MGIVALIIFNITITLGCDLNESSVDLENLEALASEGNYKILKSFTCSDGNGTKKSCEFDPRPESFCNGGEESCPTAGATGTGDGYTNGSPCDTYGHNYAAQGTDQVCTRCSARISAGSGGSSGGSGGTTPDNPKDPKDPKDPGNPPIDLRQHDFHLDGLIWKCSKCNKKIPNGDPLLSDGCNFI